MNLLSLLKNSQLKLVNYIELKKNETLFRENEECRSIGIVISGEIKIVSYSFEGREIIYSINKENTIFGNNLIFSSLPFYKGSIIAKTNCKIALISKNNLIKLLQENEEFLLKYLSLIGDSSKKLNEKNKILSFDKAKDRILYYLYKNNNCIKFTTITDLASELNLKRETLSRTLSKLVKEKEISIENKIIKTL